MKKLVIPMLILALFVVGCGNFRELETKKVADEITSYIDNANKLVVYNETNDPNNLLGRQGQYVGKASWTDKRTDTNSKNCTIEVFTDKESFNERKKYLNDIVDNPMFQQYIYTHKNIIMRISGDLTPEQSKKYKKILKGM